MPEPKQKIEGFVFVVTYGRSGSTLVQNLLNAIPGYCIRGENNNALAFLARAWRSLQSSRNIRNHIASARPTTAEEPWYGAEAIQSKPFGKALATGFVRHVLVPPPGTRVAGFKEIRWGNDGAPVEVVVDFARRFFPNARFVFNTRDHEQVLRSGWWAEKDPDEVRTRLTRLEEQFDACQARYPDRAIRIHYNDYVADHQALRPLFDFLGETYDADTVARVMARPLMHLKDD